MSDFSEMREALEASLKKRTEKPAVKPRFNRPLQALAAMVFGATMSVVATAYELHKPVGQVSADHCKQTCQTFTFAVK